MTNDELQSEKDALTEYLKQLFAKTCNTNERLQKISKLFFEIWGKEQGAIALTVKDAEDLLFFVEGVSAVFEHKKHQIKFAFFTHQISKSDASKVLNALAWGIKELIKIVEIAQSRLRDDGPDTFGNN